MRHNKRSDARYEILIIDSDCGEYYDRLSSSLKGCNFVLMSNKRKVYNFFSRTDVDLVILEHTPDNSCVELLNFFQSVKPSIPVIITTAFGSEDLAVKAFRCGARDYVKKPPAIDELSSCIRSALSGIDMPDKTISNQNHRGIHRGVEYIHGCYTAKLKVSDAAREAGMSVSSFERRFKQETGVTFTRYVNNLRVTRAVELMKDGYSSMCDIAFVCGFTNQFHFSRIFKQYRKVTPTGFKKSLKNRDNG